MRIILAILLMLEATQTGLWVAGLLPTFTVYDWIAIAVIVLRAMVGAFQFASGWLLIRRLPPADRFAESAFLASAALMTVEIGFGVAPSSLFPEFRWPVVGAYWLYALLAASYLRFSPARRSDTRPI